MTKIEKIRHKTKNYIVKVKESETLKVTQSCLLRPHGLYGPWNKPILEWVDFLPSPGDLPNPGIKPAIPQCSGFFTI